MEHEGSDDYTVLFKRSILSTDSFVSLVTLLDLILTHKRLTILVNADVLK